MLKLFRPFCMFSFLTVTGLATSLSANDSVVVGEVETAFNMFKNHSIVVERFDDPAVENVSCYISRAKTGGLSGAVGLATDPNRMSIACRATGDVRIIKDIDKSKTGELVFSEKTSAIFKTLRVTRIYDTTKEVLVYLVWSTQLVDGSPFNNVTAVPIL